MHTLNKDVLILSKLSGYRHTANETIESIRRFDFENGIYQDNVHHYTHLNKRFAPLQRAGLITQVGTKKGKTNKTEKIWTLTKKADALLQRLQSETESEKQVA